MDRGFFLVVNNIGDDDDFAQKIKDHFRDDHDRCCCECGDHFDGTLEDDYCWKCWDALGLGDIHG